MKKTAFIIPALLQGILVMAQYNAENLKTDYTGETTATFESLRLYPVHANDVFLRLHQNIGKYTVLENAVKDQKLMVSEVSGSGTVNTLYAENVSTDSIFIMAGEIVKGGKQDRIIAQDFIIAPGDKVDVGAFCVEHGRWQADGMATFQLMDGNDVIVQEQNNDAYEMAAPKFESTAKVVSADVRKAAVVEQNQGKVWAEVDEVTEKNEAGSVTGTYNALENSEAYQKNLERYITHFSGMYKNDPTVIGVVAVTGDRIIGCDLFATHALFADQYENLLHSFITDALTNGETVTIKQEAVQKYMDEFLSDESKQDEILKSSGKKFENNGYVVHCTRF